jgi:hypothetical protein
MAPKTKGVSKVAGSTESSLNGRRSTDTTSFKDSLGETVSAKRHARVRVPYNLALQPRPTGQKSRLC